MKQKRVLSNIFVYVMLFISLAILSTGVYAASAVNLGTAGNYAIFSKTAIANPNANSVITGNIGTGPGVTSTAITGFALILPAGGAFSTSAQVSGNVYAFDYAVPTPTDVDTASNDMLTAYNDAAGIAPDFTELYAGDISGQTLVPGVYKWSNSVLINTDVTLSGSASDVWIFEIAGDLNIAPGGSVPAGIKVILSGGAQASNVFWQVGGPTGATLGTYSTFNGNILSAKQIIVNTGAVLNGRALAQTQVSLDANIVTAPTATPPVVLSNFTHTQKDLSTWVPFGINANITYSATGNTFSATGVPDGYTLVYYPNVGNYSNYTGEVYLVQGTSTNLPMSNDLNGGNESDYCTNGFNPSATVCQGAKLWLVPTVDLPSTINSDGSYTIDWSNASNFLFETGLISYTYVAPYEEPTPVVEQPASGGSGGGSSGCGTDWVCSDWSSCSNGEQTRTCEKALQYCYAGDEPALIESCSNPIVETPAVESPVVPIITPQTTPQIDTNVVAPTDNSLITGQAVSQSGYKPSWWVMVLILAAIAGLIIGGYYLFRDKE